MFLSEPQIFQCDASLALKPLIPTYCHHLNSEDKYYPELALEKRQAHGGTLALWHSALDPFISILPTTSPAVLPLLLSIPGLSPSVHIGIYLPTSGRDDLFVIALAALSAVMESVLDDHHGVPIYDELAQGGESLTGIVWCFPKIECTLPVLEDTVTFRFAWGLFYSRDHEF